MKNLLEIIKNKKNNTFLIDVQNNKEIFYGDLAKHAVTIYAELIKDISPGEFVGIMLQTAEFYIPAILACWQSGATPVILDPSTPIKRLEIYNSIISPSIVLLDNKAVFPYCKKILNLRELLSSMETPDIELSFSIDESMQPAIILFSSGTTGIPKCIPLSYKNIFSNVNAFSKRLSIDCDDIFLCTSPLWYAHGLYNSFLTALILGAKIIYGGVLNVLNAQTILDVALKYKAGIFHITPSMIPILSLIGLRSRRPLPEFRYVICGTAKLSAKEKEKFELIFDINVTQQYGMTEVLFISVNHTKQKELAYQLVVKLKFLMKMKMNCLVILSVILLSFLRVHLALIMVKMRFQ